MNSTPVPTEVLTTFAPHSSPTTGNTGAATAKAFIDYFSGTLPIDVSRVVLLQLLGGDDLWMSIGRPLYGYRAGLAQDGISILYDGRPEMGTFINVTGTGCRALEARGVDLLDLLQQLRILGLRLTRIDTTQDDASGLMNFDEISACLKNRHYTSRLRHWELIESGGQSGVTGRSIYIGSRKSDTRIRIYEKTPDSPGETCWLRVEHQSRDDRAEMMLDSLLVHGEPAIRRVLRKLIEFKDPGNHSQRERWPTAKWWVEFLDNVQKLQFQPKKVTTSVERSLRWFNRQVLPTLAMLYLAAPDGAAFLANSVDKGMSRHTKEHATAIALYLGDSQNPFLNQAPASMVVPITVPCGNPPLPEAHWDFD